MTLCS